LFDRLALFVAEARAADFAGSLLVDGSFVTGKPDPNDIDLVLVLPSSHDLSVDLPASQYDLVSKKRVQKRFRFDIVVARENSIEYERAVAFFQQIRGEPALRKGVLRLAL
jgi:hypothetical protein